MTNNMIGTTMTMTTTTMASGSFEEDSRQFDTCAFPKNEGDMEDDVVPSPPPPPPPPPPPAKQERAVSFGSVEVREHERMLGNTPAYMGLSLGWEFHQHDPIPFDDVTATTTTTTTTTSIPMLTSSSIDLLKRQQQDQESSDIPQLIMEDSSSRSIRTEDCSDSSSVSSTSSSGCDRLTAQQRLRILNQYGYSLQEVLCSERAKKAKKSCRILACSSEMKQNCPIAKLSKWLQKAIPSTRGRRRKRINSSSSNSSSSNSSSRASIKALQ